MKSTLSLICSWRAQEEIEIAGFLGFSFLYVMPTPQARLLELDVRFIIYSYLLLNSSNMSLTYLTHPHVFH